MQDDFIANNETYVNLIVDNLRDNDELMEMILTNSKETLMQSDVLEESINELVIASLDSNEEQSMALLEDPELITRFCNHCYEQLAQSVDTDQPSQGSLRVPAEA